MTSPRSQRPTVALVHGGAHGAWCWDRFVPILEGYGYETVAMDLPASDESAGCAEYAEVVLDSIAHIDVPIVLVGHSLGGLTIPLVASARQVVGMIFIAALLPNPGMSFREQQATESDHIMFPYSGGFLGLRQRFYNRCSLEDAEWAMSMLRPQSERPFVEKSPLEEWPSVPIGSIVCGEDNAVNPSWAKRAARERLGVEPFILPSADHSPFLSRPHELGQAVDDLIRDFALTDDAGGRL